MPTTLLSLSDEILQRIAHFTNRDAYIPFPSFRPHWSNFGSEITSANQLDFLAFRSTCKRIHSACNLKNLQVYIRTFDSISFWIHEVPVAVLKGIRRARISLDTFQYDTYSPPIAWTLITTLLTHLVSLEELSIEGLPLCRRFGSDIHRPLRLPPYPVCRSLKSLSIDTACTQCSTSLHRAILPLAADIRHIRMAISATLKPTTILDELSNLWCQANDQTEIPLVTLILGIHHSRTYSTAANLSVTRSTTEEGAMHVMPTIGRLFPKLHNLFITSFTGDRYFFCDIPFTIEDPLKIPVKSNDPDVDFVGYLSNLRFSTNLRYLDCGISFLPGANPPVTPDARASVSKKVFIDQLRSFDKASDEYQEHLRKFRNRLRDLIGIVLLHLPSLQGGAFWEPTVGDTYPESWLRWSWSIEAETETPKDDSDAHGKRRKDGGSCVVVDTKPICFNYPFMLARNGDSIPSSPSRSFLTNTQGVEEGKKQDRDGDISRWEEDDNW